MVKKTIREVLKSMVYKSFGLADNVNLDDCDIIIINDTLASIRSIVEGCILKSNPYPKDIFIEPTKEQYAILHQKLQEVGLTLDKFSGAIGRMIWENIQTDIKSNLDKIWEVE